MWLILLLPFKKIMLKTIYYQAISSIISPIFITGIKTYETVNQILCFEYKLIFFSIFIENQLMSCQHFSLKYDLLSGASVFSRRKVLKLAVGSVEYQRGIQPLSSFYFQPRSCGSLCGLASHCSGNWTALLLKLTFLERRNFFLQQCG